jgi:hypothetical protein
LPHCTFTYFCINIIYHKIQEIFPFSQWWLPLFRSYVCWRERKVTNVCM